MHDVRPRVGRPLEALPRELLRHFREDEIGPVGHRRARHRRVEEENEVDADRLLLVREVRDPRRRAAETPPGFELLAQRRLPAVPAEELHDGTIVAAVEVAAEQGWRRAREAVLVLVHHREQLMHLAHAYPRRRLVVREEQVHVRHDQLRGRARHGRRDAPQMQQLRTAPRGVLKIDVRLVHDLPVLGDRHEKPAHRRAPPTPRTRASGTAGRAVGRRDAGPARTDAVDMEAGGSRGEDVHRLWLTRQDGARHRGQDVAARAS